MVAAARSVSGMDVAVWEAGLEELFGRVADCFRSDQPRAQARAYVAGFLSRTERKNGWTLAEFTREAGPQKMRRLLNEYAWDTHAMRDVVQSYVVENLTEPDGVLVVDETGFVKKAPHRPGCSGSTAAPRAGLRTVRSGCSPPMFPGRDGLSSTGSCTFPRVGPTTGRGARRRVCRPGWSSRPSRCWQRT